MRSSQAVSGFTAVALLIAGSATIGCGGDATTPERRSPSTLQANSPTALSAAVGTAVTVAVIVRDAGGNPVSGVSVSLAVTGGGGSIAPSSAQTDAAGLASGSWVLGTVAGPNELTAAVSGIQPVVFAAAARAGPAAAVEKVAGDDQEGQAGAALQQLLSVRVKDAYNNPVPATAVTFTVTSGGGTTQGSAATTNSEGLASAGPWTLGAASTDQTMSASIGSAAVVFTARLAPCPAAAMAIGAPVAGTLAPGDCVLAGALADRYELAAPQATAVALTLASTAFARRLTVTGGGDTPIASDDQVGANGTKYCVFDSAPLDGCHTPSTSTEGSAITLLAAPGSRLVTVTSSDKQGSGAYTLEAGAVPSSVTGCGTVFIERGVTTTQSLAATDCVVDYGGDTFYYSDDTKIYLKAGSQLRVSMSSSEFTPWLDFFSPTGGYLGACVSPGTAACTFTVQSDGYYLLAPSSFEEKKAGAYTLTVN